ncbi:MAG: tetratricopeptide repeat protein, partial [Myxococcota bacterium]
GRPNMLLFFPALAAWWAYALRDVRAWVLRLLPLAFGVALMILPFTIRNAVVGGDRVLITAHGGVNLYIGNNPGADGWFRLPRGSGLSGSQRDLIISARRIAEREAEKALKPSEVSRYWQGRAVAFMRTDPGAAFDLFLKKTVYLLNAYEKPMVANVYYARERSVVQRWLTARYGLLITLALLGMMLAWPERKKWMPLYLFVLTYGAGVVLFFVSMRYRLPMAAGLFPFAGLTLARAIEMLRSDRAAVAVWGLVGMVVGLVVGWPSLYTAEIGEDMAHTYYYLGGIALDEERPELAASYFQRSLTEDPDNARYKYRLARSYIGMDRTNEAIKLLEEINDAEPNYTAPYLTLGMAYRQQGRLTEAVRTYRAALQRNPRYKQAWNNLGNVLTDLGRYDDAIDAYQRALKVDPGFTISARGLIRVYEKNGQKDKADAVRRQLGR